MSGTILLTFDVEEFDAPLEYGRALSLPDQMAVGQQGCERVLKMLGQTRRRATLFVTASFAAYAPALIKCAAASHEIASHGLTHGPVRAGDAKDSRELLSQCSGQAIRGFRSPRMGLINPGELITAGYQWDSSVNPVWLPGRYDNRHLPRVITQSDGLVEIPASCTPTLRLPLFWLSVKNLPLAFILSAARRCLALDGHLMLYFHPWEFVDLAHSGLPRYMRHPCGEVMMDRLLYLLEHLERDGECLGTSDFLARRGFVNERSPS
ncbi:MAG: DUF3473 domain-containing protein [Phycisphaerales bacterium]|nr:DUF3473 domain-containing protein [Phycisphaerales bacterium]